MSEKISLLYLCTGNACRSQMAEGWTRALKGLEIDVYSAGIETHGLNPKAVKVMAEVGIDISGQTSQHIDEFENAKIDYVITVCKHAHETCPWFPANCSVMHVGFDDPPTLSPADAPEDVKLDGFRRVRDEIKVFVESLPRCLSQ
ncbi:MAG: arsenate reductase [Candidatus Promineifilaceae bacterium]|jgi:arsenate reductase